jgi:hypothetical protein
MVTVGLLVACALQAVVDQMADLTARAPFTEDRVAHSCHRVSAAGTGGR